MADHGVNEELDELADLFLYRGLGKNERSVERDLEKIAYQKGFISPEDLQHYDPDNDWDTQDSAYVIVQSPDVVSLIEPSECDARDDGNVRNRHPKMLERRALMRRVDDTDDWGSSIEENPALGINEGPRKICRRCKRSKGPSLFSPDKRNIDGLQAWCKLCRKAVTSQKRKTSE